MHIDVGIVAITLVAYVRLHHRNATSVIITIFTSTCIITLVARGVNHFVSGKSLVNPIALTSPPHTSHFS